MSSSETARAKQPSARRIALNAHLLNLSGNYRSAGINWYIYYLLKNLPTSEYDYIVFAGEPRAQDHFRELNLALSRIRTHHPLARIAWEQMVEPLALRRNRIDLLHALAFAGPMVISIPWVATVFDLSFMRYPNSFNAANRIYLRWAVSHAARHADRLIAISESTKRDLVDTFHIPADRVTVTYCGYDPIFGKPVLPEELASWRERREVVGPYILHVGTIEPRKNIIRLIRAFAQAKRIAHLPHTLALVGGRGWKYGLIERVIEEEGLVDHVRLVGYVQQDELPFWYRAADVFAYPSLYEGFGLPPLEALASGVPVVCSNASSLPEVVGDAALLVDPTDQRALADAIIKAATDRNWRQDAIARGQRQANKFSWSRTARDTVDIYHTVLAERRIGTAHATA